MAQVPGVQGQSVAPNSGGTPSLQPVAPAAAFGAGVGEAVSGLGATAKQASDLLTAHAETLAGLANKSKADAGFTNFAEAGNKLVDEYKLNVRGGMATQQAADDAAQKLETLRTTAATSAGVDNPMAKAMYEADSRRMYGVLAGQVFSHTAAEAKQYTVDSSLGRENASASVYAGAPADPAAREQYLDVSAKETTFRALQAGLDPTTDKDRVNQLLQESRGKVFAENSKLLAVSSPTRADAYLDANREFMDPKSYAYAKAGLKPSLQANEAAGDADAILQKYLTPDGGGSGFAHFATPQAGLAAADKNLQSYGSAHGINTLSGVISRWAPTSENDTASYTAAVSKATGIDPNAKIDLSNPATRKTILSAMANVEQGKNNNPLNLRNLDTGLWAGQVPSGASVDSAAGGPMTSVELEKNLQPALSAADALAEQRHPGNDVYKNTLEQQVMSRANRSISIAKDTEGAAYQGLVGSIVSGQIEDLHTLLSSSPDALNAYNSLPGSQQKSIQAAMRTNADQWSPTRQANAVKAAGLYANRFNDPQAFLNYDAASADMRRTDQMNVVKEQQEFRAKPVAQVDKPFNAIVSSPEFSATLAQLGIPKTLKGKGQNPDYSHLLGAVSQELDNFRADNPNKPVTPKDVASILARATAMTGTYKNSFLGASFGPSHPNTEEDHAANPTRAFDVSPADRKGAIAFLTKHKLPTDEMTIAKTVYDARGRQQ